MNEIARLRSVLRNTITRYIDLKRALGREYAGERRILAHLDRFLANGNADLTPKTFARWCGTQEHMSSGVRRNRMRVVRNLCLYRRRTDPCCFVPDVVLFPPLHQPVRPHIFSEDEIARLLRAADTLQPASNSPLRREVFRLAIVLLYTAGLRRGELLRLTVGDYDPLESLLHIRASKFHKSRLVPLSPDATKEIDVYLKRRSGLRLSRSKDAPLLCNLARRGDRSYSGGGLAQGLRSLLQTTKIRTASGRLPRVHDFRHAFAVRALLRWYRSGMDVQAKLPFLAAYMGHVSIVSTEYYLPFVEDLATSASERFARHCGALVRADHGGKS